VELKFVLVPMKSLFGIYYDEWNPCINNKWHILKISIMFELNVFFDIPVFPIY
jgi:hypothetical protein